MTASKPVLFVEIVDKAGDEVDFRVTEEGRQVFEAIENKLVAAAHQISVVTIAGPQRTGKSFLANRLLNRMTGFAIGPTTVPCTKGIWIWSQPIILENSAIVIMDTEGLFSVCSSSITSQEHHHRLQDPGPVAAALDPPCLQLVAPAQRSFGHIDEVAIENLGLVARLVDLIKVDKGEAGKQQAASKELGVYFPYFVWCLRDFTLDLDGRSAE